MKSNTQRQAAYRKRHLQEEESKRERLNMLIDLHAKRALERLAVYYGITQRALLERLLSKAEWSVLEQVGRQPQGYTAYYDKRLRIEEESDVSQ